MDTDPVRGGLAGKILRINLSEGKIWDESVEEYIERFIGGRTINSYILLNETRPGTKWSSPDNLLIFGAGCLVGTPAPGACRTSIDSINCYSNGKGSANFGGHFGAELKYAGYDHIVITGKSEKPVYIWICDGKAELRDADHLWGKTTYETQKMIQKELNDNGVRVAAIGPAGEKCVIGAGILGDTAKMAGGSGVGCIMGDKKVKAVAVRGHGMIKIARPEKFINAAHRSLKKVVDNPSLFSYRNTLFSAIFHPGSALWDFNCIVRNGQDEWWPAHKIENLLNEASGVPQYRKRVLACSCCPVGCMPFSEIDKDHEGAKGTGYWINSVWYSQMFDVDNPTVSLKWHLLANKLGIDGDMAAVSCSWAFECFEKGLLTKKDTDGLELTWGNGDAMMALLEKLANRQGFGDFLADGVKKASQQLGKGSEYFAACIKNQDTIETFRIRKARGLGIATSACGGRHLRGALISPDKLKHGQTSYNNAAQALFEQSQVKEIEDTLGICILLGSPSAGGTAFSPADYTELVNHAVGLELDESELYRIGRRGINLEKAFNTIHAGFGREDDLPPKRYMDEPVQSGPHKGLRADKEEYHKMLDQLYELHGWDKESGLQTRECLTALDMEDVAEKIERAKMLPE